MKYFFGLLCLFCFGCDTDTDVDYVIDEEVALTKTSLLGEWKLEATKVSPGGPVDWSNVEDGNEYTFFLTTPSTSMT
ncbi:MAG: hypothetical protein COA50_07100 [Flavobacteriaceae bacterium]|nr:MAG: hypothetical protein COA50_07100 [Flavobacteriaceae bacterium]